MKTTLSGIVPPMVTPLSGLDALDIDGLDSTTSGGILLNLV